KRTCPFSPFFSWKSRAIGDSATKGVDTATKSIILQQSDRILQPNAPASLRCFVAEAVARLPLAPALQPTEKWPPPFFIKVVQSMILQPNRWILQPNPKYCNKPPEYCNKMLLHRFA